jgi:hypothetical protein
MDSVDTRSPAGLALLVARIVISDPPAAGRNPNPRWPTSWTSRKGGAWPSAAATNVTAAATPPPSGRERLAAAATTIDRVMAGLPAPLSAGDRRNLHGLLARFLEHTAGTE